MGNASTCSIIIGRHDMTHAYVYLSTLHGDLRFISSVFIKHQIMSIQTNGTMLMSSIKLKINNTGIQWWALGVNSTIDSMAFSAIIISNLKVTGTDTCISC